MTLGGSKILSAVFGRPREGGGAAEVSVENEDIYGEVVILPEGASDVPVATKPAPQPRRFPRRD